MCHPQSGGEIVIDHRCQSCRSHIDVVLQRAELQQFVVDGQEQQPAQDRGNGARRNIQVRERRGAVRWCVVAEGGDEGERACLHLLRECVPDDGSEIVLALGDALTIAAYDSLGRAVHLAQQCRHCRSASASRAA